MQSGSGASSRSLSGPEPRPARYAMFLDGIGPGRLDGRWSRRAHDASPALSRVPSALCATCRPGGGDAQGHSRHRGRRRSHIQQKRRTFLISCRSVSRDRALRLPIFTIVDPGQEKLKQRGSPIVMIRTPPHTDADTQSQDRKTTSREDGDAQQGRRRTAWNASLGDRRLAALQPVTPSGTLVLDAVLLGSGLFSRRGRRHSVPAQGVRCPTAERRSRRRSKPRP
ncbi:hypothetical protein BDD21_2847 [Thiocapsa rosea]|uniref:Uncharacterized protein n=1 Tax=Thiocapsa rosea TaxID=69360 RepID=A0A495VAK9_9GAMM|nr:hypothetical protein BDD21_2847 [Thiocapsa rosea]